MQESSSVTREVIKQPEQLRPKKVREVALMIHEM